MHIHRLASLPLLVRTLEYEHIEQYDENGYYRSKEGCDFGTGSECHYREDLVNYISDEFDGAYEIWGEFFSEMSDMDIDGLEDLITRIIVSPYCLIEIVTIEDFSSVVDETLEELIFLR